MKTIALRNNKGGVDIGSIERTENGFHHCVYTGDFLTFRCKISINDTDIVGIK